MRRAILRKYAVLYIIYGVSGKNTENLAIINNIFYLKLCEKAYIIYYIVYESAYEGEMSMYKFNCVHSPDYKTHRDEFAEMVISEAERIEPIIREQLLREYILGMGDTDEILKIYCDTFGVDSMLEVRMMILKPAEIKEREDFMFIKNTAEKYIGTDDILLSTIVGDHIIVITRLLGRAEIAGLLEKLSAKVKNRYGYGVMAVYSKTSYICETPDTYERLKQCMGYFFYSDGCECLYENDIKISGDGINIKPEYGAVERAVRSGDRDKVKMLLGGFFKTIEKATPAPAVAKTYCLELYVCIIRCCGVEKIDRYMKGIASVRDAGTLERIKAFIENIGLEITDDNAPETNRIYSTLIRDTINIIDENIENENLSLRWLAGTILYTNVDYLGKLFKKETGKNFSHYVMEKRMEMAKDLILEGKKDRIYEVAEKVGYGSNSQYFSQVFKKYTGVSPLEYKEFARLSRENGGKQPVN